MHIKFICIIFTITKARENLFPAVITVVLGAIKPPVR